MRLQIMRDQAGALVGRRRTARRARGQRQRNQAAVIHRLQQPAQQRGLLAGLPGMRHLAGGRLIVAGQRVEAQVDAGRQHQTFITDRCAVGETDHAGLRIDLCRRLRNHGHALGDNLVIAELLRLDIPQAGDDFIAERTGDKNPVRFDQRHLQLRIDPS